MIKTMPGGRWYCDECDEYYSGNLLTIQWTAGVAPQVCSRCAEPTCLAIFDGSRPVFVSIPMSRREAVVLQRTLREGGFCSPERGLQLKRQMANGQCNELPWTRVLG